ncbi:MAG: UDP-N-acetylmuramate--L-alanine ligase [Candidatus Scalindua sp.]|jgi:UDP-N-acetylmuramate--alanine ligase|nr:UDP-N-acetylmuramate--L-alanine ligase [Candidatus Scalindua sp.]MBT5307552.1 UDP-N-acetylmuramate--L-alanine ligase [Candidatus Scalindua sp.]MBT6049226.1 UDP-N-acetylmuramate--L-alanine ligase [Candidatus Scalindua sp.]MBT6225521.1 UDP-N-acetylmuramate--L-alanine ligase [Candidatus Scalindua sp.]MBT6565207.1 UDP-N-acetylmuramate--L-alanine ligase [Candidatus Scalindua sp.]
MKRISKEHHQGRDSQNGFNIIDYVKDYGKYVYFIGIGGAGMSAIAKILINEGYIVSGSDMECSPATYELGELGVRVDTKQDGECLHPDTNLVITSAAINENNPDLKKARSLGLRVVKYSEFLGSLMKTKYGIAISGTHGKTTTTAMISTILKKTGLEPTFVIGGNVTEIGGNSCTGKGSYFIAEACEYDRTFLNLAPQIGVITNIEEDHLDYYKDLDGITDAFTEFVSLIPEDGLLVINNDDANVRKVVKGAKCKVESYSIATSSNFLNKVIPAGRAGFQAYSSGLPNTDVSNERVNCKSDAKWLAVVNYSDKEVNHFSVFKKGEYFGDFCLKTPGLHNVSNALAAISVCNYIGLNGETIKKVLASFNGVSRRFQTISSKNGITIIDDFAHHPTAIKTTLETARAIYPSQRIWCVFQPHQHNRTKLLLREFAMALTLADKVIIANIYASRDSDIERASVSSLDLKRELQAMGGDAECIKNISEIIDNLRLSVKRDDIVMILGAGDIWKAAHGLKSNLENAYD